MKKHTVNELLSGYSSAIIPDHLSNSAAIPVVSHSYAENNSLLFVTDKSDGTNIPFDCSILNKAPIAMVVSKHKEVLTPPCPVIRVDNSREALSYALSNYYGVDYGRTLFIGVTGTNGKTTTASLIYEILRASGYKVGFIGTGKIEYNGALISNDTYSMTTPDPTTLYPAIAKMQEDGYQYIVMEVSSHGIALGKVAPIRFEYSIFTNLDNDHLDFHHSKEDYFTTKLRLFSISKQGLFNLDDEYSRKAFKLSGCKKSTFGIIQDADAYATEILENKLGGLSFYYREDGLIFKVNSSFVGAFNVYNILASLRCVIDLGIKPCIAKKAIEKIKLIDGRMEIIKGTVNTLIDYAHTPSAFYNCLKTAKALVTSRQKLIVVFGCGGNRDKYKRPIFGKYANLLADTIIITEDNCRNESFESIASDIVSEISCTKFHIIPDRETAIRYAYRSSSPGDLVALIGKGHEKYKIVGSDYITFDERKIALEEMERLHCLYES